MPDSGYAGSPIEQDRVALAQSLATKAGLNLVRSFAVANQTGTGSPQNVAHGLGQIPATVLVIPIDGGTVSYTKDGTNIVVTCTNTKKYDVLAIA
jgi:hypothetical protein